MSNDKINIYSLIFCQGQFQIGSTETAAPVPRIGESIRMVYNGTVSRYRVVDVEHIYDESRSYMQAVHVFVEKLPAR